MPDADALRAGAALLLRINFPLLLGCLLVFAALLVFFDAFCRAMSPRSGTTEWIAMYDRPRLSFSALCRPLSRGDFWPLLAFSVLSAGLGAFGVVLLVRQGEWGGAAALLSPDALLVGQGGCAVFCALSLLPCWLLVRALTGRSDAASGAAALFALTLVPSGAPYSLSVPCVLLAAWCFLHYLSAQRRALLWLPAAGALFFAGVWCAHIVLWFGIGFVALFAVSLVLRVRARALGAGGCAVHIALLALVCVLGFALTSLPEALLERGMALPQCLLTRAFWRFAWVRTLSFRILIDPILLIGATLLDPPFWWGGLLAALCALALALSRRDGAALCAAVLAAAGALVWVFSGSALGGAACALTLGLVFARLLARGHAARAYVYCVLCLVLGAALPVLALLAA